jgi:hypothetical protein
MDAQNTLEQAQHAAAQGDRKRARALLRQFMWLEPRNELAWLLFASVAQSKKDELYCFERVLRINPNNEKALSRLGRALPATSAEPQSNPPAPDSAKNLQAELSQPPLVSNIPPILPQPLTPQPVVSSAPQTESRLSLRPTAPTPANKGSLIPILLVMIVAVCLGGYVLNLILYGTSQSNPTSYGRFNVPGTAYLDGRDPGADPPLTVMSIPVMQAAPLGRIVCRLPHGAAVSLLGAVQSGGFYYFHVQSSTCEGWLVELYLSTAREQPIGNLIP